MKKVYLLVSMFLVLSFGKVFSQSCVVLGCAANYGTITTDGTLPDQSGGLGDCYTSPSTFKQVFWQFFYSPSGGDFTQTYTPISGVTPLDIDWVVFDVGTSAPLISCPLDSTSWTQPELICNFAGTFGDDAGPGVDGTLTTTAGHYYAIGIIVWQGVSNGGDPSYTFSVSAPQIGGVPLTGANCPGVLPVKLSSFTAEVNDCIVHLKWTAASEIDFKNYEVQYSTNGVDFQTIAVVPASSNNNSTYSYEHDFPQQGKIYYRLKMVDIDGKFEYSKVIALQLKCGQGQTFIYPNPVSDVLNINITNVPSTTSAFLFDSNGKLMYSGKMISGTNAINMSGFAKGIYLLKLENSKETKNIKIIKQ